jgi:hypothetical protein
MSFEEMLQQASARVSERAERGEAGSREISALLDCYQSYNDLWERIEEKIFDGKMEWDDTVTVKVDGKTVKFDNIEQVAEWLTNEPK